MVASYRERHCWHDAGRGPKGSDRDVCCDCGKYRRNKRQGHGRYRPAVANAEQERWADEARQAALLPVIPLEAR